MTDERLRELFSVLTNSGDAIYDDNNVFDDLKELVVSALSKPQTKFEAWKQGLTIEDMRSKSRGKFIYIECEKCPVFETCNDDPDKTCFEVFKEWGEQDAD